MARTPPRASEKRSIDKSRRPVGEPICILTGRRWLTGQTGDATNDIASYIHISIDRLVVGMEAVGERLCCLMLSGTLVLVTAGDDHEVINERKSLGPCYFFAVMLIRCFR